MPSSPVDPATPAEAAAVEYLKSKYTAANLNPEDDGHFFDGDCYLRFVRKEEGNKEKAEKALKEAIEWRKSYKPYAINPTTDCPRALKATFLHAGGVDKSGRLVFTLQLAYPNDADVNERAKLVVAMLEAAARKGYEYFIWVSDFSHVGKENDPKGSDTRDMVAKIFDDYYPERNQMAFMFNPPWFISTFSPLATAFMSARARARLKKNCSTKDMLKVVAEDQLPTICGGTYALEANVCEDMEKLAPVAH